MANYYESARTNYFAVKDAEAFKKEIEDVTSLEVVSRPGEEGGVLVSLLSNLEEGFPFEYYDEEAGEGVEIDWKGIFQKHLKDEEVAIIIGAGAERLRFINGWAVAFNNKGEEESVSLDSIYKLALNLGSKVTRAEY
jgi:hypothetical protein